VGDFAEGDHQPGGRPRSIYLSEPVAEHPHGCSKHKEDDQHAFLCLEKGIEDRHVLLAHSPEGRRHSVHGRPNDGIREQQGRGKERRCREGEPDQARCSQCRRGASEVGCELRRYQGSGVCRGGSLRELQRIRLRHFCPSLSLFNHHSLSLIVSTRQIEK